VTKGCRMVLVLNSLQWTVAADVAL
jgi:hypothetical protein